MATIPLQAVQVSLANVSGFTVHLHGHLKIFRERVIRTVPARVCIHGNVKKLCCESVGLIICICPLLVTALSVTW